MQKYSHIFTPEIFRCLLDDTQLKAHLLAHGFWMLQEERVTSPSGSCEPQLQRSSAGLLATLTLVQVHTPSLHPLRLFFL